MHTASWSAHSWYRWQRRQIEDPTGAYLPLPTWTTLHTCSSILFVFIPFHVNANALIDFDYSSEEHGSVYAIYGIQLVWKIRSLVCQNWSRWDKSFAGTGCLIKAISNQICYNILLKIIKQVRHIVVPWGLK